MDPSSAKNYWQPDSEDGQDNAGAPAAFSGQGFGPAGAPEAAGDRPESAPAARSEISWEASEFIHHEKDWRWFAVLLALAAVLAAVAVWAKQWSFAVLLAVMTLTTAYFANRRPRVLRYRIGPAGIDIEDRHYDFGSFSAFGVTSDASVYTIVLLPVKRFAPAMSIYFDPKDGEKIVDVLAAHLPMERVEPDIVDKLTRKLRF